LGFRINSHEEAARFCIQMVRVTDSYGDDMMSDSCNSIRQLLSAFYDGELSVEAAARASEHVESCSQCQAELQSFGQISDCMQATANVVPPTSIWEQIAREMVPSEQQVTPAVQAQHWTKDSRFKTAAISVAASVLLLVGAGIWFFGRKGAGVNQPAHSGLMAGHRDEMSAEHRAEFVDVMDAYLHTLPDDSAEAEQILLEKYKGERVDERRAVELVGYRPIVSQGLPEGYSLASTSVLQMPCCTCVKAVCQRADGSTLVLFEHDDEEVTWFGDRSSRIATCGDKECCLVELDKDLAATWRQGSRSITAVGIRDDEEVAKFVSWMHGSHDES